MPMAQQAVAEIVPSSMLRAANNVVVPSRGYWLESWATIGNIFFREVIPDSFPLFVCKTQCHAR